MLIGVCLGALSAVLVIGSLAVAYLYLGDRGNEQFADASNPKRVAWGRGVYKRHCASCHGEDLKGTTGWRHSGERPAPLHVQSGPTWLLSDWELFELVMLPGTDLQHHQVAKAHQNADDLVAAANKDDLGQRQVKAVIAFIKSTWPEDIRLMQDDVNKKFGRVADSR